MLWRRYIFFATLGLVLSIHPGLQSSLVAGELKKVLILDFVNEDRLEQYDYLESSISDAVKKSLGAKFAFSQTRRHHWEAIATENFLFKEDLHTKSAAMNLGLLCKQDVVITGSFTVTTEEQKGKAVDILHTQVRILDVSQKAFIAAFTIQNILDSTIFQSVEKIAGRITHEAQAVLPSKDDWAKSGMSEPAQPLFENPIVGFRAGGAHYLSGYADRFEAAQPAFGAIVRANLPALWYPLTVGPSLTYLRHSWRRDFNNVTRTSNIETSNYVSGLWLGADLHLSRSIVLHPKLGGGYVFQNTTITGEVNKNVSNSFPFAGGGLEFIFHVNSTLGVVVEATTSAELESGTVTYLNTLQLGMNLRL